MNHRSAFLTGLLLLSFAACGFAAKLGPMPSTWVNGEPISSSALKGKVAVLYFYEEGCPTCRAKWPGLLAAADQYKDKPVVFIAVNSGNEAGAVEGYIKSVGCTWPTIVDKSRAFEKTAGVGTISTSNIYQLVVVDPDGNMRGGNPADIPASVNPYLTKAAWKVDPATVPDSLKAAWKAVEFGEYTKVTGVLRQAMSSRDEKTKAAAEAMTKAIDADLNSLIEQAQAAEKAGDKFAAYKLYREASQSFKGMPKATEAAATAKKLAGEKELKDEVRAMNMLEQAQKLLASRNRQQRREGDAILDQIVKDFADTEAAGVAKSLKASSEE